MIHLPHNRDTFSIFELFENDEFSRKIVLNIFIVIKNQIDIRAKNAYVFLIFFMQKK